MQHARRNIVYVLRSPIIIRHELNFKIEGDDRVTLGNLKRWSAITVLERLDSSKVKIRTYVTNSRVDSSGEAVANLSQNRLHHRLSQRAADRAERRLMQVIDVVVDLTLLLPFLILYFYVIGEDVDILQIYIDLIGVNLGLESLRSE